MLVQARLSEDPKMLQLLVAVVMVMELELELHLPPRIRPPRRKLFEYDMDFGFELPYLLFIGCTWIVYDYRVTMKNGVLNVQVCNE